MYCPHNPITNWALSDFNVRCGLTHRGSFNFRAFIVEYFQRKQRVGARVSFDINFKIFGRRAKTRYSIGRDWGS
jgi:hypothetical protein